MRCIGPHLQCQIYLNSHLGRPKKNHNHMVATGRTWKNNGQAQLFIHDVARQATRRPAWIWTAECPSTRSVPLTPAPPNKLHRRQGTIKLWSSKRMRSSSYCHHDPLGSHKCARIHLNLGHALVGPRSEQAWPMLCDGSRLWNSLLLICLPHHAPTISWFLKVLLTSDMLSKSSLCVGTLIGHKRAVSIDGERYIVDNFLCHCGQMRN